MLAVLEYIFSHPSDPTSGEYRILLELCPTVSDATLSPGILCNPT